MSHFHHYHSDDSTLILRFSRAVGLLPKYFLFADSLAGTPTVWPSLVSGDASFLTGSATVDEDGYNGKKSVTLTANGLNLDAIMGSHQGGQERTVLLAINLTPQATARTLICSALASGTSDNIADISLDLNDFGIVKKGTNATSPASEIPEGTPIILAYVSNGTSVRILCRTRGETSELLDTTIAETSTNHDQLTLFARRINATVSQQASVNVRVACGFQVALSDTAINEAIRLIESPAFFNCNTVEDPEVQLARMLGNVTPKIFIHSKDLVVGTRPTTIPNRGLGPDVASVNQPVDYPPVAIAYNSVPTLMLKGDGYLNASSSIDGSFGTYDEPQLILLALEYDNTGGGKTVWMNRSTLVNTTAVPYERGETVHPGEFRMYNDKGDGTAEVITTNNTPVKIGSSYVIAYSKAADGDEIMGVRYRTKSGVFSETYVEDTRTTGVTTPITQVSLGGFFNPGTGHLSSDLGYVAAWVVVRGAAATDLDHLKELMDFVEDPYGMNLPMGSQVRPVNSVPHPDDLDVWLVARLSSDVSIGYNIDDLSYNSADGAASPLLEITTTSEEYDFSPSIDTWIQPTPLIQIPTGTGALTVMAFVSRKAGAPWSAADSYCIQGISQLGSAGIFVHQLKLQAQWNSGYIDSGIDVSGWVSGDLHIVAYTFDGTNIRFYLDGFAAPVATVAAPARTVQRALFFGAWGATSSWRHTARSFSAYVGRALTGTELQQLAVASGMQMAHLFVEGDQNIAIDAPAPAGVGSFWNQAKKTIFPEEGYTTNFAQNRAVSGSCWLATNTSAPVSMSARGAALDAAATAGRINILLLSCTGNDVNLPGMTLSTLQSYVRTYCDARIASGKWHKIIISEIPPQTLNSGVNALITSYNAWLPTLISENRVHAVVDLPSALLDDQDETYFFPNASITTAPTYNAAGNSAFAAAVLTALRAMNWS